MKAGDDACICEASSVLLSLYSYSNATIITLLSPVACRRRPFLHWFFYSKSVMCQHVDHSYVYVDHVDQEGRWRNCQYSLTLSRPSSKSTPTRRPPVSHRHHRSTSHSPFTQWQVRSQDINSFKRRKQRMNLVFIKYPKGYNRRHHGGSGGRGMVAAPRLDLDPTLIVLVQQRVRNQLIVKLWYLLYETCERFRYGSRIVGSARCKVVLLSSPRKSWVLA